MHYKQENKFKFCCYHLFSLWGMLCARGGGGGRTFSSYVGSGPASTVHPPPPKKKKYRKFQAPLKNI